MLKELYFVGIEAIGEIKVVVIKSKEYVMSHDDYCINGLRFNKYYENEEDANKQAIILSRGSFKDSPKYRVYKNY